jgi:beta-glucosidase
LSSGSREESALAFPKDFLWGSAISAYQTEGGNKNNQWYAWERKGSNILDGSVCGRADDFYHLYERDLDLATQLGHNAFRFSLEWSRIEPRKGVWDGKQFEHYRKVLKAINKRGLKPLLTLHHFTNPLWMEKEGGWLSKNSVEYFTRYTIRVAEKLGDLVDLWGPINEPTGYAASAYLLALTPPAESSLPKYHTVARNMLLAHAEAYHVIHDILGKNRTQSSPQVGTIKSIEYFQPYDENSLKDRAEADLLHKFYNESFLKELKTGKIGPPLGFEERINIVKDAWDFLGFNYYTRTLCKAGIKEILQPYRPLTRGDSLGVTDAGIEIYPEGIFHVIKWLKEYGKPLYITENGISIDDDNLRAMFIALHLEQVHRAMTVEKADVKAYFHWSLIDNFEWQFGFDQRYGLVEVDYKTLERKPRPSAHVYREIIKNRGIPITILKKYKQMAISLRRIP